MITPFVVGGIYKQATYYRLTASGLSSIGVFELGQFHHNSIIINLTESPVIFFSGASRAEFLLIVHSSSKVPSILLEQA
ncbi:hypothetical protein ACPV30_03275 [Photobacterium damselae]|uniref:hypothetical protein n=1 Tax=Photobacterium damselae TaxID=38293 RepID=UPI004068AC41